jgi:hypothetical protein
MEDPPLWRPPPKVSWEELRYTIIVFNNLPYFWRLLSLLFGSTSCSLLFKRWCEVIPVHFLSHNLNISMYSLLIALMLLEMAVASPKPFNGKCDNINILLLVTIIYFYYLFFHRRPTHKLCFISCRPFVVNATFSTGLVDSSVFWLGQLTLGVSITDYFNCWVSKFIFVAWSGLFILEFKSLMRGEVYIFGHFVLWWHHWAGIWRRLLLVFRSLQVCLFFYGCFLGVLWTQFFVPVLFSFHVQKIWIFLL